MCGISGIINKNLSSVDKNDIKKINDLVAHRGPDGEGYFFKNNFSFGHRRLAIIDLSKDGSQPMNIDGYVITYNGEIYNYIEIREELIKLGEVFETNSDTEVLLRSYIKWGKKCLNKLNGMWAFAIFDPITNQIFCSRDRFGIKPFYYLSNSKNFVFGSEIKQLLSFLKVKKLNRKIAADYLVYGFEEHTNNTFFKKIYSLSGGSYLIYDLNNNTFNINKYYNIDSSKKILNNNLSIKKFRKTFQKSISLRLRADVDVGFCLSGGLDSSSIVAFASSIKRNSNSKIGAIHARSSYHKNDESEFAKIVAKYSKINLSIVTPSQDDFDDLLFKLTKLQDEPFGSPSLFMQFKVFEEAKKKGYKVMLDGQGGDELLLGYERYFSSIWRNLNFIDKIYELYKISKNNRYNIFYFLGVLLYFNFSFIRKKRQNKKWKFLKKEFRNLSDSKHINLISKSQKKINDLKKIEYQYFTLPHLLKYEDRNSMFHSVESRLPFVDYKLVELSYKLPLKLLLKDGYSKYILRKITKNYLDDKVRLRKDKFGFESPDDIWLKNRKRFNKLIYSSKILNKICERKIDIESIDNIQLWRLINIATWEKVYGVKY